MLDNVNEASNERLLEWKGRNFFCLGNFHFSFFSFKKVQAGTKKRAQGKLGNQLIQIFRTFCHYLITQRLGRDFKEPKKFSKMMFWVVSCLSLSFFLYFLLLFLQKVAKKIEIKLFCHFHFWSFFKSVFSYFLTH